MFDLEMIEETGRCNGIENYSRHLSGRDSEAAPTLLEFFPSDFLLIADESHVPSAGRHVQGRPGPQGIAGPARLPAAKRAGQPAAAVPRVRGARQPGHPRSATAKYELQAAEGVVVEQIIRPGLLDPTVEVRPATTQVDDLLGEIRTTAEAGGRIT